MKTRRPFQNHAYYKRLSKTQNGNINLSAAAAAKAARGSFTVTCLFSDVLYFICCIHCFMCQTAAFRSVPFTQCVRCQQTTFEICILHTSWVRIKVWTASMQIRFICQLPLSRHALQSVKHLPRQMKTNSILANRALWICKKIVMIQSKILPAETRDMV